LEHSNGGKYRLLRRRGKSGSRFNTEKWSKILTHQVKSIKEPAVQHGSFVMNTREEISQAFGI